MRPAALAILALLVFGLNAGNSQAQQGAYEHDKWGVEPVDLLKQFEGFVVSFDGKDDDTGDRKRDLRRIPEWVAQHIKKWPPENGDCIPTGPRPRPWFTDRDLERTGVAPKDASYAGSGYNRGHLAAKILVERIGKDAARATHTMLNAFPQHPRFNQQIWRDLEDLTGAWAQVHDDIWVIQGPVFDIDMPHLWIGDVNERKVAVPAAVFKLVIRAPETRNKPEILAFLMPQLGPRYYGKKANFRLESFLTSVDEVEKLTGLTFLTKSGLSKSELRKLKQKVPTEIWPRPDNSHFITGCSGD